MDFVALTEDADGEIRDIRIGATGAPFLRRRYSCIVSARRSFHTPATSRMVSPSNNSLLRNAQKTYVAAYFFTRARRSCQSRGEVAACRREKTPLKTKRKQPLAHLKITTRSAIAIHGVKFKSGAR